MRIHTELPNGAAIAKELNAAMKEVGKSPAQVAAGASAAALGAQPIVAVPAVAAAAAVS